MAPEAASTHSVNLPERLPALGGDPFAQSPQSSGGDVLLPQAQPPANNNMRVQLDAQFQNQAKNNMRVQLDPQFQRVEGPAPQPVPAQPPIPPANLMLGAELDYSPRPNQEPVRQNPPPRQPVPQARDPFDAELDGRTLPAGAMDLSLPRMDPAPAQPLGNPGQIQPLAQPKPDDVHEVKSGENYWTISRQYYGSARFFSALAEYNRHRIADPNKMRPGMYLLVPDVETLHQRYPKLTGGGPEAEAARIAATRPGFFLDKNARPAFRVGKGDTLTEIAQKHLGRSTGWTEIYRLNKALIPDPNNLKLGTVLQLPPEASQVAAAPELQNR